MPADSETKAEIHHLRDDMTEVKQVLAKVVEAINRMTVYEEKQHTAAKAMEKVVERLEAVEQYQVEDRVAKAVFEARIKTTGWLLKGVYGVCGGGGLFWLLSNAPHFIKG